MNANRKSGVERAAIMLTFIMTAASNVDPKAWLADVFRRIAEIPQSRLHQLLPWEQEENVPTAQAA